MLSDNFLCRSELLFWAIPFFAVLDSMLWQGNAPFCWFSSSLPSPTSELNYIGLPHQEHKRMVKESSWCQHGLTHKTTLSRKEPWNPESKAWSWFLSQDLGEGKWSVEQWSWMRCPTPSPVPWPLCFCTSNVPLKLFYPNSSLHSCRGTWLKVTPWLDALFHTLSYIASFSNWPCPTWRYLVKLNHQWWVCSANSF